MNLRDFWEQRELFTLERGGESFPLEGIRSNQGQVLFETGIDVRAGDWLIAGVSGKRFYVRDTDVQMFEGQAAWIKAFIQTEDERRMAEREPQPSQQYNIFGPVTGMVGNQQNFKFNQVVQDLDRQIEEYGGSDKEALREMVQEIQETLESQDSISRGKFEIWSELANKHAPWLLGPLGSLFINYSFGVLGGAG